jgi:hypothetical protein
MYGLPRLYSDHIIASRSPSNGVAASRLLGERKPAHFRAVSRIARIRAVRVDHSMPKRRRTEQ